MDTSNFKIPQKRTINYRPPKAIVNKQFNQSNKPKAATQENYHLSLPPKLEYKPKPVARPVGPNLSAKTIQKNESNNSVVGIKTNNKPNKAVETDTNVSRNNLHSKPQNDKKHYKKLITTSLIIIVTIILIAIGAYFIYEKIRSKPQPEANSNSSQTSSNYKKTTNPVLAADYIVYGIKPNSLFTTDKNSYQQESNAPIIKTVAKSTYPNDKRELTISQQKVDATFSTDPEGLKKMADSIGPNTTLTTNKGTSYIITGNATGIVAIGATLISVRTSASLALLEWQQFFNDLEPVQI
jgi:hypothetical protein